MKGFAAPFVALLLAGCGSSVHTVTHVERAGAGCNGIAADLKFHYAICGGHRAPGHGP